MQLLTSEKFITQAKFDSLLLIDKFTESCMKLDASILVQYIEEDDLFEDKGKYLFLAELKKLFQPYQSKTNVFSVSKENKICLGCSQGKPVIQFTVYFTQDKTEVADFGFVIDKENGILKDIYRCWQYKECQPFQIKLEGLPAITIQGVSCK